MHIKNVELFSVTRSKTRFLNCKRYNTICHVKIQRNSKLDGLAFTQPARRLARIRSVPNMAQSVPMVLPRQQTPNIDLTKIRSILKNPIGKPRAIFARRKSMPARVSFQIDGASSSHSSSSDMNMKGQNSASSSSSIPMQNSTTDLLLVDQQASDSNNTLQNDDDDSNRNNSSQVDDASSSHSSSSDMNLKDQNPTPSSSPIPVQSSTTDLLLVDEQATHSNTTFQNDDDSNRNNSTDMPLIDFSDDHENEIIENNSSLIESSDTTKENDGIADFDPIKSVGNDQRASNNQGVLQSLDWSTFQTPPRRATPGLIPITRKKPAPKTTTPKLPTAQKTRIVMVRRLPPKWTANHIRNSLSPKTSTPIPTAGPSSLNIARTQPIDEKNDSSSDTD